MKNKLNPMKTRKSIASKMEIFYKEVETKRKGQKTGLQMDQEIKQKNNKLEQKIQCSHAFHGRERR